MNNKKMPAFVKLLILTAFTVVIWVGFETYRILTDEPAPDVPTAILEPISPTLDTQTLISIEEKVHLSEEEIGDTVIISTSTGSEPLTEESDPIPPEIEPTPEPQPEATSEGEIVITDEELLP